MSLLAIWRIPLLFKILASPNKNKILQSIKLSNRLSSLRAIERYAYYFTPRYRLGFVLLIFPEVEEKVLEFRVLWLFKKLFAQWRSQTSFQFINHVISSENTGSLNARCNDSY